MIMVSISSYPLRRGKPKGMYVCDTCQASFLFFSTLEKHLQKKEVYHSLAHGLKDNQILFAGILA